MDRSTAVIDWRGKVRYLCGWSSRRRCDTAQANELARTWFLFRLCSISFSLSPATRFLAHLQAARGPQEDTLCFLEKRGASAEWWSQRFGGVISAGAFIRFIHCFFLFPQRFVFCTFFMCVCALKSSDSIILGYRSRRQASEKSKQLHSKCV